MSRDEQIAATKPALDPVELYAKLLRVRARLGLVQSSRGIALVTEIRLLDEMIEEVDRALPE